MTGTGPLTVRAWTRPVSPGAGKRAAAALTAGAVAGWSGRGALYAAGGALGLAGALLGGAGWVGAERAIHRRPPVYGWGPADYPDLGTGESWTVASRTRITLGASFFPGRTGATVIVSHGYGGNRHQVLPWARFLHAAGWGVVTYDMRGRGESGGDAITLGALEQEDLLSLVDDVARRPGIDPDRLALLGVSLGGAISVLAAARDPRIRAVVADCPFADASSVIATAFRHFIGLPAFPFSPVAVAIAERRIHQRISGVRPVDAMAAVAPRPVLLIHGGADPLIPPAHTERLLAVAPATTTRWVVPGAGHGGSFEAAGEEYVARVVAFLAPALVAG